jgi:S1-C subfamily serine protease
VGAVYGLYHATHRGYISAISPIARPQLRPSQLTPDMIRQLNRQLKVYQLDITSFPGNSGGPVFDIQSGEVVGLVNSTFIKDSKDKGLERPSGITFAMPAHYLVEVLKKAGIAY